MERQDLRSVLRLFAEVASNMHPEESWGSLPEAGAGLPQPVIGWTCPEEGNLSTEQT